jgi:hypothetical protein
MMSVRNHVCDVTFRGGSEVRCFLIRVRLYVQHTYNVLCVHVSVGRYCAKVKLITFKGVLSPISALARYQCLSLGPYSALQR